MRYLSLTRVTIVQLEPFSKEPQNKIRDELRGYFGDKAIVFIFIDYEAPALPKGWVRWQTY